MNPLSLIARVGEIDRVNFVLTNYIPRRACTRFMAWFSRIEHPLIRDASLWLWQLFGGSLRLDEAKHTTFASMHDCFIRELKSDARIVDHSPTIVTSPCDAIVGACGRVENGLLIQAKGRHYPLAALLEDGPLAAAYSGGVYATLRLTSTMYHHFHAPYECEIHRVSYIPGDAWNVNGPTLDRKDRIFCINERAVIEATLIGLPARMLLVPVAAVLVGGIHLKFAGATFTLRSAGPVQIDCRAHVTKGEELGHFLHGSTIIALGSPGLALHPGITTGVTIRMGSPLFMDDTTRRSPS